MAFYRDRYCLVPVSKDTKGELKVRRQKRYRCKKPRCVTLKVGYRLRLTLSSHQRCDKVPRLDGAFRANLNLATQTDGHGRGFHEGRFKWASNAGTVVGRMRGTTNAGTHRGPLLDNCEACNVQGHLEGQLEGRIADGRLKGCLVRASYVINYDPGLRGQDTGVWGTLEGVVVCPCKDD